MDEKITIQNAGLVLCNTFLPRLFSILNLTDDNGFKDRTTAEHAVQLLKHIATGAEGNSDALPEILCGIALSSSPGRTNSLTQQEKEMVEQMLNTMILHWSRLGAVSVQRFAESFLVRKGILTHQSPYREPDLPHTVPVEDQPSLCWHLKIEQKGYDILLDSLPWSYTPIKYQWMQRPLRVQWR